MGVEDAFSLLKGQFSTCMIDTKKSVTYPNTTRTKAVTEDEEAAFPLAGMREKSYIVPVEFCVSSFFVEEMIEIRCGGLFVRLDSVLLFFFSCLFVFQ